MNLKSTTMQASGRQMVLLAPSLASAPEAFGAADVDPNRHAQLLAEMQRLRGAVYLQDGAIGEEELSSDGRHMLAVDDRSWHVLTLNKHGEVSGCSRYLAHSNRITYWQLELVKCALARSTEWGRMLQAGVESEIALARQSQMSYVEVGGWALSEELRCTTEALRIALATYSLASILGGCIGISTVTVRNCSSSILKRIGGSSLSLGSETLPRYFDPQYNCEMDILRFDSRAPKDRFREWIESIKNTMLDVPVVCASTGWPGVATRITPAAFDRGHEPVLLPKTA